MSSRIDWHFPRTDGGISHGYVDPGIEHFGGAKLSGLARETIQNSLDARVSDEQPVHVTFEIKRLDTAGAGLGFDELARAIRLCIDSRARDDDKARIEFGAAYRMLSAAQVTFLRIEDRNTTGLRGEKWRALVKEQGTSYKDVPGAGGSFGIGKSAPFSISPLRTVYYYSRFDADSSPVAQFQGKAILVSHGEGKNETQGTGFFGITEQCGHLVNDQIPIGIQNAEKGRGNGTSLWIPGFDDSSGWQKQIARNVIENFFCAIDEKQLVVLIDLDEGDSDLLDIKSATLSKWFDKLSAANGETADDSEGLEEAKTYLDIMNGPHELREKEDSDLGHCRLWIRVGEGLPQKVALIRRNGMIITSQQKGLRQFRGIRDFAAVCRFESPSGNELYQSNFKYTHEVDSRGQTQGAYPVALHGLT